MTSDRHARVEALYKAALDLAPADRSAFLVEACGPDEALRAEIEARLGHTVDDPERTRSAPVLPPGSPDEWGGLQLVAEIGAGGFGRVYRARDRTLARDVALKVIALQRDEDAAAVLREGQMLARIRHRNVVTVHAAQRIGDQVGVTMELVDGQNLADLVRQNGPMGAEEAAVIGLSLCQALAAVHAAGLVHRDVKARNVMREQGGRIVLMDFGLGLDVDTARGPAPTTLSGTPPYIAPELFEGEHATPASDLYSLGVLLFFLVTRNFPVRDQTLTGLARAHARGERQYLSDLRPDLPRSFVRVVEHAVNPDPALRYRSAGAMMRALAEAIPEASTAAVGAAGSVSTVPADALEIAHARVQADRLAVRWIAIAGGLVLGIGVLGLLTSTAFNVALQRTGGFSDDTVADWFEFGARSLVSPAIYTVLTLSALLAARACWRILGLGARSIHERGAASSKRLGNALGLADPAAAAQWLLVAQGLALAVIVWQFYDVLEVWTNFPDGIPTSALAVLSETSFTPLRYRQALSVALAATMLSWHLLLRRPLARQAVDRGTKAGGLAIAIIMLLVLELPYRLMFQSYRPVVEHEELRCYELGRRPGEVLTYCPDWDVPRIRILPDNDGVVRQTGVSGHLFTVPGSAR